MPPPPPAGTTAESDSAIRKPSTDEYPWLTDAVWNEILFAEAKIPLMQGLTKSIVDETHQWEAQVIKSDEPENALLPGPFEDICKETNCFIRLLLVRILRKEKGQESIRRFIVDTYGKKYVTSKPMDLEDVYQETNNRTPIIFILSTGADPTAMLQRFAEKKGWQPGERLHIISLGQGQVRKDKGGLLVLYKKSKDVRRAFDMALDLPRVRTPTVIQTIHDKV